MLPCLPCSAMFLAHRVRYFTILLLLLSFVGCVFVLALGLGPYGWQWPLSRGPEVQSQIFLNLRLPRGIMGMLVGAGLAMGGLLTQAVLRNPLASPFTLGISSGAAFGASLVILAGGSFGLWHMAGCAFVFAALTAMVILGVATLRGSRPETLILAGVAVMFLFSAATSFVQFLGTEQQVSAIVFWSFGNLGRAGWAEIIVAACMILLPAPFALRLAWDFNALACGEEGAAALGVSVRSLRIIGIVAASAMTAGAICFTGVIGFVGLVGPHVARFCLGSDHRLLLPGAALFGAGLVTLADALARLLLHPQVIPVGIVTAFLGVPFFFWLLLRKGRGKDGIF